MTRASHDRRVRKRSARSAGPHQRPPNEAAEDKRRLGSPPKTLSALSVALRTPACEHGESTLMRRPCACRGAARRGSIHSQRADRAPCNARRTGVPTHADGAYLSVDHTRVVAVANTSRAEHKLQDHEDHYDANEQILTVDICRCPIIKISHKWSGASPTPTGTHVLGQPRIMRSGS